jgi:hypothetical protein
MMPFLDVTGGRAPSFEKTSPGDLERKKRYHRPVKLALMPGRRVGRFGQQPEKD